MATWGANDPIVQDFGQSDPVVQDGPDMEAALKEVMSIAQSGGSKQQADQVAQSKYGVTLDDVSKYYDNKRGIEIWGVPVPRSAGSFVTGYGQGLTSNWGDELRGRVKQGAAYLTGQDPQAAYTQELQNARDLERSAKSTNPAAYYGGQIAGTMNQVIAAPGLTGSKFIAAGQSLPSIAARSGLVGLLQGALSGAGAGDHDLSLIHI